MCLNEHDPIKWKVIRYHHLIECEIQFAAHRTQKGTLVNIMRGPLGFFWKSMVKDVKAYIKGCGECNRMRPMTVACSMGRTMLRDSEMHYGFSHVSLDPLGILGKIGQRGDATHHTVLDYKMYLFGTYARFNNELNL